MSATVRRFCEAANSGNLDVVRQTIDEVVDPGVRNHMLLPVDATGKEGRPLGQVANRERGGR